MSEARIGVEGRGRSRLAIVLLVVGALFYAAGFLHPRADFPNGSPWNDWAKMTDEGWYGGAAAQHYLMGSWFLPQSFNPAVAMPVWPAMLWAWFAVAGVSMAAARELTVLVYGVSLVLLYLVVRRDASERVAALAVLLMAVNPFCYAFDRLAVLEPLTVFWMMLGLWLAGVTGQRQYGRQVLLGVVLFLLVLTKPTGVALVPAVLYLLWAEWGWPRKIATLWPVALVVGVMAGLWAGYFLGVVKPRYLADYKLLFSVNNYRVHLGIVPKMAWVTMWDGRWIQPVLFALAVVLAMLSCVWLKELWRKPLFGSAVIAAVAQLTYIGYHTNFQARYYLVAAMPAVIVLVLGLAAIWERRSAVRLGFAAVMVGTVGWMMVQTLDYVLHPQYSFLIAAQSVAAIVDGPQGGEQPVLLSDSGGDIMLFTGVSAINVSYTTDGLDALFARYKPGWYAAWPGWEDRDIKQVARRYQLQEVARYEIFDDPKRQTLVLYKLTPRKL